MEYYYFKHSGLYAEKDLSDKDKYIVLACAKNEEDYIIEWIEHYLRLGFDKIIIADNNDVGNDSLPNLLADYVSSGRVQIIDARGTEALQVGLYTDFCEEGNFKWCAFYDCDEFLEIGIYKTIQDYLEQFDKYDIVLLNWLVFGPNGQIKKTEGGVQERFKRPQGPVLYFKENSFVKSIVRGGTDKFVGCHFNGSHLPVPAEGKVVSFTVGGYFEPAISSHAYFPPRYKNGYIKHYYTKSFEEWIKKADRGWPDGTDNLLLSKYLIFEHDYLPPLSFMETAVFKVDIDYSAYKQFEKEIEAYDVLSIRTAGEFTYPMITEIMDIFQKTSGHTFLFTDDSINDTLFTIMLEYGYATGNRVLFCRNNSEIWNAYLKYGNGNTSYYIINFG